MACWESAAGHEVPAQGPGGPPSALLEGSGPDGSAWSRLPRHGASARPGDSSSRLPSASAPQASPAAGTDGPRREQLAACCQQLVGAGAAVLRGWWPRHPPPASQGTSQDREGEAGADLTRLRPPPALPPSWRPGALTLRPTLRPTQTRALGPSATWTAAWPAAVHLPGPVQRHPYLPALPPLLEQMPPSPRAFAQPLLGRLRTQISAGLCSHVASLRKPL